MTGTMVFICVLCIHIRLVIKRENIGAKLPEFESCLCHCITNGVTVDKLGDVSLFQFHQL